MFLSFNEFLLEYFCNFQVDDTWILARLSWQLGWIKHSIKNLSNFPGLMIYQFPRFPKQWTEKCLSVTGLVQLIYSHIACHPVDFIMREHRQTVMISESPVKSTMHDDIRFSSKEDLDRVKKCTKNLSKQQQDNLHLCVGDKSKLGNIFWYVH